MIDLHCHILPGMDDGPADIGESLDMARQAVLDGIHTVVATPHSRNGMYVNVRGDICRRVQELNRMLEAAAIDLVALPGAEELFVRKWVLPGCRTRSARLTISAGMSWWNFHS